MAREEIMQKAVDSILELDGDMAAETLEEGKAEGISALEMLQGGFAPGMGVLGEQFANGEVFVPELLFASTVMNTVTEAVNAELEEGAAAAETIGKIVIGTVEGDVHDIGKGLCVSMLKATGFEVFDLGKDVPAATFVEKAKEVDADIIASSALLTTTMAVQEDIEKLLTEQGLRGRIRTMVGGAPVTQDWADQIGASAYSEDAMQCCEAARKLMFVQ